MSYFAKIGVDASEWIGGIQAAQGSFLSFYRDVTVSLNMTMQIFHEFERVSIEVFNATIGAAEKFQEEIEQFSVVTGMSTDATQKWRAAAIATDTSFESLTQSMVYLESRITDTTSAGDSLRKTLTDMGVQVKDTNGNFVDSDTLLQNILTQIDKLPTAQLKDAAAKEIWGRSWSNLAQMINNSRTALQAYKDAQPAFSEEDLKNVEEFKVKWAQIADNFDIAKAKLGLFLIDLADGENNELLKLQYPGGVSVEAGMFSQMFAGAGGADWTNKQITQGSIGSFKDQYEGLSDLQIELKHAEADVIKFTNAMKADTTDEQFQKDAEAAQKAENAVKRIKDEMNALNSAAAAAAKSTSAVWNVNSVVGSAGSEMQLFLQKEMEAGVTYQEALNNWTNGAPTATNKEGTLGAAMGAGSADTSEINDSETEQNNLLKSDVRTQKDFNKNLDRSQSKMEDLVQAGKDLTTELTTAKKAADGLGNLDGESNYSQQLYDETLTAKMREQWKQQEADGLTHYGSLAEMSRVRSQAEIDYMAVCVNFAGENPIIQNKIIQSATGPDWVPVAFTAIDSVKLVPADFTNITTLIGGSSAGSGSESNTSQQTQAASSTAKATIVNNITIQNPQGLSTPASIQQASKALANALKRGSAT
jgi:hypothetical protein